MCRKAHQNRSRLTSPVSVMSCTPRMFWLFAVDPGRDDDCGRPTPGRPPRKLEPEVEELRDEISYRFRIRIPCSKH